MARSVIVHIEPDAHQTGALALTGVDVGENGSVRREYEVTERDVKPEPWGLRIVVDREGERTAGERRVEIIPWHRVIRVDYVGAPDVPKPPVMRSV